jgi:hypothetical protein
VYLAKGSLRLEGGVAQPNKETGQAYQRKNVKCIDVKYIGAKCKSVKEDPGLREGSLEAGPVYKIIGPPI